MIAGFRRFCIALTAAVAAAPVAAAGPVLGCAAPTATVTLATAPEAPPLRLELPPVGAVPAVLVGEETGVDLEWQWAGEPAFHDIDARPPRFGTFAVPLRGGETLLLRPRANAGSRRPARLALQLYCDPPMEIVWLPPCLAAPLSPLSRALAPPGGRCEAQGLHAQATRAARAGDNRAALQAYERAAAAWQARGDRLREGAAWLGAAEIRVRLGHFDAALATAERSASLSRAVGNAYFATRAGSERCLALRELGRRAEAQVCQQDVAAEYGRLDEAGDAANAYVSLASMAHEDGDAAAAGRALAALDGLDPARWPVDVEPRAALVRAALSLEAGRLSEALSQLDLAARRFETAGNARWLANAELSIAGIYAQLSAWEESRLFAADALSRLPAGQAAARRAEALRLLALGDAASGADPSAAARFGEARQLLAGLDARPSLLGLDLDEAAARHSDEALARADAALAGGLDVAPRQRARLALLHAALRLRRDDAAEAARAVEQIDGERLAIDDYLRWRRLRALLLADAGQTRAAFALIEADVDALRTLARGASAPGLRAIAGRRLLELRAAWLDVSAKAAGDVDVDALWNMLQRTQPAALLGNATATMAGGAAFESALADWLIGPDAARADAQIRPQRELLRYYATSREPAPETLPGLAETRALLPADAELLVLAAGGERELALSLTRERAEARWLAPVAEVQAAAQALQQTLATAQSPASAVDAATERLSAALLAPRAAPPPARLLLMPDDRLAAVPFALLRWADGRALVDTSTVSLVPAGPRADSFLPLSRPSRIDVLIAAAVGDGSGRLPALPRAADEFALVRSALNGVDVVGHADAAFTRERLLGALEQPQSWLHVAAHGINDARLQSYSGLWLPGGGGPVFVSWLDLVERPVQADLLVLSACNLGGGIDRGVAGAANFATALSVAGARHVVAALWPLSDSAGTEFTRAFYAELARADAPDPAAALRAAQLRLRASAHFRHPYYWSLFVHLQH